MLLVQDRCEYRVPWKKGSATVQRSRSCPYLWIRLCEDTLWYFPGFTHSSICRIIWVYRSFLKNARNQLRDEILSRRIQDEQDEDEQDEDSCLCS
jgi:hypothetical protein